jgi:hypothetical protein
MAMHRIKVNGPYLFGHCLDSVRDRNEPEQHSNFVTAED